MVTARAGMLRVLLTRLLSVAAAPRPLTSTLVDVAWGSGEPRRTAYVIAEPSMFSDGRIIQLQRALGAFNFVRVNPVQTDQPGCGDASSYSSPNEDRARLLSHRNAWAAIALSGERSLVIEGDFTVGALTNEQLLVKMATVFAMADDDLTHIGWCDECPADTTRAPCWGCSTGYVLHPRLARSLVRAEFCMSPGHALVGACPSQDAAYGPTQDWARAYQAQVLGLGVNTTCNFLYETPLNGQDIYYGMFQMDKVAKKFKSGQALGPTSHAQQRAQ